MYYVFPQANFVVPLKIKSQSHYKAYDFMFGGEANKVRQFSQVGAVANYLLGTKFEMYNSPTNFGHKNEALPKELDQGPLGAVVGFGIPAIPILDPSFIKCKSITSVQVLST